MREKGNKMIDSNFDDCEITNSPDYSLLNPSDFIFGFAKSNEGWVYITPKKYWEDNGVADDSSQQPNNLPEFILQEMEGAYSSIKSLSNTKKALLDLGFVYDKSFEDWNRKHQSVDDCYNSCDNNDYWSGVYDSTLIDYEDGDFDWEFH
jgi:hypothetical protein